MTELVRINTDMDIMTLGNVLAKSGYFQDARDAAQVIVKILAGRELGIGPIAAMSGVYIVNGKPALSANLMASAIKRSNKYDYRIREHSNESCMIEFFERGESVGTSQFTLNDAQTAGATTGKNQHTWRAYPRNMLFARALSNGARWYCPDIFGGPIYTPEELDAQVNEEGEVIIENSIETREYEKIPRKHIYQGYIDRINELRWQEETWIHTDFPDEYEELMDEQRKEKALVLEEMTREQLVELGTRMKKRIERLQQRKEA